MLSPSSCRCSLSSATLSLFSALLDTGLPTVKRLLGAVRWLLAEASAAPGACEACACAEAAAACTSLARQHKSQPVARCLVGEVRRTLCTASGYSEQCMTVAWMHSSSSNAQICVQRAPAHKVPNMVQPLG